MLHLDGDKVVALSLDGESAATIYYDGELIFQSAYEGFGWLTFDELAPEGSPGTGARHRVLITDANDMAALCCMRNVVAAAQVEKTGYDPEQYNVYGPYNGNYGCPDNYKKVMNPTNDPSGWQGFTFENGDLLINPIQVVYWDFNMTSKQSFGQVFPEYFLAYHPNLEGCTNPDKEFKLPKEIKWCMGMFLNGCKKFDRTINFNNCEYIFYPAVAGNGGCILGAYTTVGNFAMKSKFAMSKDILLNKVRFVKCFNSSLLTTTDPLKRPEYAETGPGSALNEYCNFLPAITYLGSLVGNGRVTEALADNPMSEWNGELDLVSLETLSCSLLGPSNVFNKTIDLVNMRYIRGQILAGTWGIAYSGGIRLNSLEGAFSVNQNEGWVCHDTKHRIVLNNFCEFTQNYGSIIYLDGFPQVNYASDVMPSFTFSKNVKFGHLSDDTIAQFLNYTFSLEVQFNDEQQPSYFRVLGNTVPTITFECPVPDAPGRIKDGSFKNNHGGYNFAGTYASEWETYMGYSKA